MLTERVPLEEMTVLVEYMPDGSLSLKAQALSQIENFLMGKIHMVCFEGFHKKGLEISQQVSNSKIKTYGPENCILMRPHSVLNSRTRKHIYYLQMAYNSEHARKELHLFASIICNVVVVAVGSSEQLSYLTDVNSRVIYSSASPHKMDSLGGSKKYKTASLMCIEGLSSTSSDNLNETSDRLMNRLNIEGILNDVNSAYSLVKGYECSEKALKNPTGALNDRLMREIEAMVAHPKGNSQLMYNKILGQFMSNVVAQINQPGSHTINIDQAEDQIELEQAYAAYHAGVTEYHQTGLSMITNVPKPDSQELEEIFKVSRIKALEAFYAQGGSSNLQYKRMLEDYIENKNAEVTQIYSQSQWNQNLEILQLEQKGLLDKISRNKVRDHATITSYINEMTKNYESRARGPRKHELFNDYMKIFTPVAYSDDPEKIAQLRREMERNQELRNKLNELKKQKGGCCQLI